MLSQDAQSIETRRRESGSSRPEEQEAFFAQLLRSVDEPTLPFGVGEHQSGLFEEASFLLEPAVAGCLRGHAGVLDVTLDSLIHLVWAQVLARVSGRSDVVFGTAIYGESQKGAGAEHSFASPRVLPVRFQVGDEGVGSSALRMQTLLRELSIHREAAAELIQRSSGIRSPAPLFSAVLDYRSTRRVSDLSLGTRRASRESESRDRGVVKSVPFVLIVEDSGESLRFTVQAPSHVGAHRVSQFVVTACTALASALDSSPAIPIVSIQVLPDAERRKVLVEWNSTETEFPKEKFIHQLFEEQVARTPSATALIFEDESLTYEELNRRANRLAHHLSKIGVRPDSRVAICMERSFEMVIALLAVIKAGGAYVPLDPSYPSDRWRFMLEDCSPVALLVQSRFAKRFSGAASGITILDLERDAPWAPLPEENPDATAIGLTPQHLAYLIYTSGSTGVPKGVMVEHMGLVNRLVWMQRAYRLGAGDAVLQKTPFGFDVSVWEFFWPIFAGSRLVIARPEGHKDPAYLCDIIRRTGITTLHFVPSMLQVFLEEADPQACASLTRVVCSGEALSASTLKRFSEVLPGVALHNLYGPTEATVDVTAWNYRGGALPHANPPIGKPIANTRMYILNESREPVPIGVPGELYIAGVQVARGYINRPGLTQEKFFSDPFCPQPHARMYRTGDLARWLTDGNIEYLGRNDFQVKIRGFRIELGEIESRLSEHPDIREAVVIAREDTPGEKWLVAYYTTAGRNDLDISAGELRSRLGAVLPDYMVPSAFLRMESLPVTINGKLDRKALPVPAAVVIAIDAQDAPVGDVESALAKLWAGMFRVPKVGRRDSFFDLGGHSLMAARMIAQVRSIYGVRVALFSFIQSPTIESLANLVAGKATSSMVVLKQGTVDAVPMVWVAPEPWLPRLASCLSPDQPVLSFVLSPEELASAAPEYRLEDLAACVVNKIRQSQTGKTLFLSGFCQTSLLAMECAQQLRRIGYEIPLLVMGDVLLPGYDQRLTWIQRARRRLQREAFYVSSLHRLGPSQWSRLFSQRMGGLRAARNERSWKKYSRSSEKGERRAEELQHALIVAHQGYVPSRYPGRAIYLQSRERPQGELWNIAASWRGVMDQLEIFESPGDHTTIFQEPHVRVTAGQLQKAMDRLNEGLSVDETHPELTPLA